MSRGPKGFSDEEKEILRDKLCKCCEERWSLYGYKKTSISDLTKHIGVATGSFYLLFVSKEELFCETLRRIQNRLKSNWEEIIRSKPDIEGFREAMIWLYKEYRSFPFLYDFNDPDYLALVNRIPNETIEEFEINSVQLLRRAEELAGLVLKIEREKAYAVLSTLLYTVSLRERIIQDDLVIYEFLLDCTLQHVFCTRENN